MRRLGFEFLGKAVPDRIHQAPQTSPVAGPQAGDLEPNISKELLLVELDNIIATLELEDEEYNWHPSAVTYVRFCRNLVLDLLQIGWR